MDGNASWHSDDAFWHLVEPMLFTAERLARAPGEVDQIEALLDPAAGARILDLGCGIGRHSLALAARGYTVTGIDRTVHYIERARAGADARGLAVDFRSGDMRDALEPERFDLVLNLFGSFGYFSAPGENRQVVANAYNSLRPGGQFMIETAGKEILARGFPTREWEEVGDLLMLSEKHVVDGWRRMETRWIAIRGAERIEHRVSVRCYSAVELAALLEFCGFIDIHLYGSLAGAPYDQTAQRLVIVGRKPSRCA